MVVGYRLHNKAEQLWLILELPYNFNGDYTGRFEWTLDKEEASVIQREVYDWYVKFLESKPWSTIIDDLELIPIHSDGRFSLFSNNF